MPGIYERDQINYGGMLGNAMAAKANYLKNRYDRVADIGRTWGNAVSNSGKAIQNALNQYAQQQYNREQLAAQQQYQAEQNALNREDVLKRAREQQAWQAEQNRLQRESTENIAGLNRQSAKEDRMAQNMLNYQNMESIINQLQFEYDNTSDKTAEGILKRAQLKSQIEQANNKRDYYGSMIPEVLRNKPEGTPVISGEDAEVALGMFDTATPKTAAEITEDNKEFDEIMKNKVLTDEQKARATTLAGDDKAKLERINQKGATAEQRQAQINAAINSAIESGDQSKLPNGFMVRSFPDGGRYVAKKGADGKWIKVKKWGN